MITEFQGTLPFIQDYDKLFQTIQSASPQWLQKQREESLHKVLKMGIPTTKDEDWKYTNLSSSFQRSYATNNAPTNPTTEAQNLINNLGANDTYRIVFLNGIFAPSLSLQPKLTDGLKIQTLSASFKKNPVIFQTINTRFNGLPLGIFHHLNNAFFQDGVSIEVPANIIEPSLIHIIHLTTQTDSAQITVPRILMHLGKSSQISVMESHAGLSANTRGLNCPVTEIVLEENAALHYVNAQNESDSATQINTIRAWCERNAMFNALTLTCSGALVRNNLDIILNGEGIDATLNGLYSLNGTQHTDNHTSVDHRYPNCVSNQLYKGILNGSARAVFNGKIFVRPEAQQTNSYQLNKNLLLGKDCRVDTKPQLEIFADDVKCTHGATIGQLDQDEVFYLQTRGISRKAAIKILARGFADELLNRLPQETVARKLRWMLEPSFARF